ncbi:MULTISPECIES: GNAT family N-acetyltransferase [unclassified Brevibacterium]|uniref:GNAT family N-acetyltransferase n=1 Tax=unclassified Brevibacterium TaxID=2614124 RepID=UPI0010F85884|nr:MULTISPECIES: GNAT family N-acetyltransferase [unclassified Brevibacterium]MCM1012724.1 GNAT family N-acetyltransferase [Brevibacterium sp. XM4083]
MSEHDLRTRIRPLPADTPDEVFVPFVDLAFNWSMDKPTIPRAELVDRPDARAYFSDWGRRGDLAVACYDEAGEEIVGLAWLRYADPAAIPGDEEAPADATFIAGLEPHSTVIASSVVDDDSEDGGAIAEVVEDESGQADFVAEVGDEAGEEATAPFAGYGWVAADIPELSIAVLPAYQGQGIGGALLDVLLTLARLSRVRAVSLAVEDGNGAAHLYRSRGFAPVGRSGDSDLLVRQLG